MRSFLVILIVALASGSRAITVQEQRQQMVGAAQECMAQVGATDNELSLLILKKPMTTKEGKCLVACIMETMGIIEGLKLVEKNFIDYISVPAKNDPNIIKKMTEIAAECETITNSDQCEMAFLATACFKKGMAQRKIKIDIGI